jgi:phospholipase C
VHGPNGFFRAFKGDWKTVDVKLSVEARASRVSLTFDNRGTRRVELSIADRYTGHRTPVTVPAGRSTTKSWNVQRFHGWHDLTVHLPGGATQQFAGHLENGRDTITDPLMGGLL